MPVKCKQIQLFIAAGLGSKQRLSCSGWAGRRFIPTAQPEQPALIQVVLQSYSRWKTFTATTESPITFAPVNSSTTWQLGNDVFNGNVLFLVPWSRQHSTATAIHTFPEHCTWDHQRQGNECQLSVHSATMQKCAKLHPHHWDLLIRRKKEAPILVATQGHLIWKQWCQDVTTPKIFFFF